MSTETDRPIAGSGSVGVMPGVTTPSTGRFVPHRRGHRRPDVDREHVLIPRPETPTPTETPVGHRVCPTPVTGESPMVRQTIGAKTCDQRQYDSYHKCSGCLWRQQPLYAGAELPPLENSPSHVALSRAAAE